MDEEMLLEIEEMVGEMIREKRGDQDQEGGIQERDEVGAEGEMGEGTII